MYNQLISVIMSIYNEDIIWIKEAIDSIQRQSYINIEIIIIVDNPKISYEIKNHLFYIKNNDKRVRLIFNECNIGLAESLNRAIGTAQGSYIARMDADDISEINRLEKQIEYIEKYKVDLVGTGRILIDDYGKTFGTYESPITDNPRIKNILPHGSCFVHPTVLLKTNVLKNANGYRNFRQSQDYDLWLRLLDSGCTFGNIDEPLLRYRVRMNSITKEKPYVQYLTAKYQKSLHRMRVKNGSDNFTQERFEAFLKKHGAYNEKNNKQFAEGLEILNNSIGMIKNKHIGGLFGVLKSIALHRAMFAVLIEKMKIVHYLQHF